VGTAAQACQLRRHRQTRAEPQRGEWLPEHQRGPDRPATAVLARRWAGWAGSVKITDLGPSGKAKMAGNADPAFRHFFGRPGLLLAPIRTPPAIASEYLPTVTPERTPASAWGGRTRDRVPPRGWLCKFAAPAIGCPPLGCPPLRCTAVCKTSVRGPETTKPNRVGWAKSLILLAPRPGLEPGTYGLTVRRSTD
jgi:hypothetical protein